jgi:hypothetical protein
MQSSGDYELLVTPDLIVLLAKKNKRVILIPATVGTCGAKNMDAIKWGL